ncbi:MAG: T9SS type A sorting domain-containing protein [Saprospiraceae bacterium]|nr:T9SS type A sorting domain-containing protein [Saprospiraceae bacterium]
MKNLLLVCLMVCSCLCGLAAQSADFAPVGAKWYYKQISFDSPYPEEFRLVEVTGEEVFQGQMCRIIEGLTIGCGLPNPSHVFTRNDSTFFWSQFTEKFELLYDFSASAGDTWLIEGLGLFNDSLRVFVDSVGQRVVNGDTLQTWFVSNVGCFDWGNEIMEKLGNLYFLSPSYCLCENGPYGIRCYLDADADYHFVSYPCDTLLYLGTSTLSAYHSVEVFPNPFHESISVKSESLSGPLTFLLFDGLGRIAVRHEFSGSQEINTRSLPAGIYFWGVEKDGAMLKSGKCVKD